MKNQNYKEELPTGVKYLVWIAGFFAFIGILSLIVIGVILILPLFISYFSTTSLSKIYQALPYPKIIASIGSVILVYSIYKGLKEIKYWGWKPLQLPD